MLCSTLIGGLLQVKSILIFYLALSTLGKCDPRADKSPFFRGKVIQHKYLIIDHGWSGYKALIDTSGSMATK